MEELTHWCSRTQGLIDQYPDHRDEMIKIGDSIRLEKHKTAETLRRRLETLGYGEFSLPERNHSNGMWAWMALDLETKEFVGGHLTMKATNKLSDGDFDKCVWGG